MKKKTMGGKESSHVDPSKQDRNLRFYRNELISKPWPGHKIEEMLRWKGDYGRLENNHHYIQWLFPIPVSSAHNPHAQPLREHEAKAIMDDKNASDRLLSAYKMMLDFYGMRLMNRNSGVIARQKNWQERYNHLKRSTHNYRRITRIIQSLGELGYERFQVPWVMFLLEESIVHRVIPNLSEGCIRYWIEAIKDDREREQMHRNFSELLKKPVSKRPISTGEAERTESMCTGEAERTESTCTGEAERTESTCTGEAERTESTCTDKPDVNATSEGHPVNKGLS